MLRKICPIPHLKTRPCPIIPYLRTGCTLLAAQHHSGCRVFPALFVHNPSLSFPPPTGSPSMSSVNPLKSAVVPAAQPECSLHLCDFTETRLVPEDNTSLLYTPLTCSSHLSQKQRTRGQGQGLPVPPPFTPMTLEAWPSQPPASHQASKSFPATDQGLHL